MDETPQQNMHWRAMVLSRGEVGRKQATRGHDMFFDFNHKVLTEHAPAEGPDPVCTGPDCGKPWPCGMAETAMSQVGLRS